MVTFEVDRGILLETSPFASAAFLSLWMITAEPAPPAPRLPGTKSSPASSAAFSYLWMVTAEPAPPAPRLPGT